MMRYSRFESSEDKSDLCYFNPLRSQLTIVLLTTLLTGCQLLPTYQYPLTPTPERWKNSYTTPDADEVVIPPDSELNAIPTGKKPENNANTKNKEKKSTHELTREEVCANLNNWWEIFEDSVLNQLEEQALTNNYTLWAALERVMEARAMAREARAALAPQITFNPSLNRTGSLYQNPFTGINLGGTTGAAAGITSTNSSSAGKTTSSSLPNVFRFVQTEILSPLEVSYELDLWSKLTNTYYSDVMKAQATAQDYLNVLLSLTADVASNYFLLRGLDAQEEVLRHNIAIREKALHINTVRYDKGLSDYLNVSRSNLEYQQAKSDLEDVVRLRGLQENIVATLVGVPASIFSLNSNPISVPPPIIPRGLPSELLTRRPDIMEAERNLAAAYRQIGVAYANFFPSLTLTGAIGVESPFNRNLFDWQARFWQIGWNVMQIIFDGGRIQANLDYTRAAFQEAMANYQEVVLVSFREVEDELVNLDQYQKRAVELNLGIKAAAQTLKLSQERFDRGLVFYLDVVDAERDLLQTEQTAVIVLENRYISTVRLIKTLGGGWSSS